MKIGVRLSRRFDDAGDYLADARALDSAGVDSLWLDEAGLDPWLLLGGIAAVTGRARLVAPIAAVDGLAAESLHGRVETLQRLSRGRGVLAVAGLEQEPRGLDAIVHTAQRAGSCVLLQARSDRDATVAGRSTSGVVARDQSAEAVRSIVEVLAREREESGPPFEVWATMEMPDDRETWRKARAEYEAAGATGVIVAFDARLLDLLRNGDEEDDRSDLGLAQG